MRSDQTCSLAIAGIGVALRCNNPQVVAALQRRYHCFASGDEPQLVAQVRLAPPTAQPIPPDKGAVLHNGNVEFTAPGYRGFIDGARGTGELVLQSAQPLEDLDYFVRVAYAVLAFKQGGLLFHGAGIVRGGQGFLFFGRSGSGKTTVARLSPHDTVLNDDLVVLMPSDDDWTMWSTPFSNPTQVQPSGAHSAPLGCLLRLVQAREVWAEPLRPALALAEVVASVPVLSLDATQNARLLAVCGALLRTVPAYRLHFLPDTSFWPVVEALQPA